MSLTVFCVTFLVLQITKNFKVLDKKANTNHSVINLTPKRQPSSLGDSEERYEFSLAVIIHTGGWIRGN